MDSTKGVNYKKNCTNIATIFNSNSRRNNDIKAKIISNILGIDADIKTLTVEQLESLLNKQKIRSKVCIKLGIDLFNMNESQLERLNDNIDKIGTCPYCQYKVTLPVPLINEKGKYCEVSLNNPLCTKCIREYINHGYKNRKECIPCMGNCCKLLTGYPGKKIKCNISYGTKGRSIKDPANELTFSLLDNIKSTLGISIFSSTICPSCDEDCKSNNALSKHYKAECVNRKEWCEICRRAHTISPDDKCHYFCKLCKEVLYIEFIHEIENDKKHHCKYKSLETKFHNGNNVCIKCIKPINFNNINEHENCMYISITNVSIKCFEKDKTVEFPYIGKKAQKKIRDANRRLDDEDFIRHRQRQVEEEYSDMNRAAIEIAINELRDNDDNNITITYHNT